MAARALDSSMEDDGPRRQIYIRAKQGKPLQTSLDDLLKFFEDAAVGKPTSVLNKWGEEPPDGRIYELALVTFKKNKAVQRALGLSGSYLSDREVATGTSSHPRPSRLAAAIVHAHALAHTRWSSQSTIGLPSRAVRCAARAKPEPWLKFKPSPTRSPSPSPSPSPNEERSHNPHA